MQFLHLRRPREAFLYHLHLRQVVQREFPSRRLLLPPAVPNRDFLPLRLLQEVLRVSLLHLLQEDYLDIPLRLPQEGPFVDPLLHLPQEELSVVRRRLPRLPEPRASHLPLRRRPVLPWVLVGDPTTWPETQFLVPLICLLFVLRRSSRPCTGTRWILPK